MRLTILVLGLAWAASLHGQSRSRFRWQDYCFNHPAAPFCPGHEYAIKRPPVKKDGAPPNTVTTSFPSAPQPVTPTVIVVGGIDWRFADPLADALVWFNFNGLSNSPLAGSLIFELGAKQGLSEADLQKIFDGLTRVDQVALSVRDNRVLAMITGRVADSTVAVPEAGLKAVPVTGNAMLVGQADAVDLAVQRIAMKGPLAELPRLAEERQAGSEFWAAGSAALLGPQAVSAGMKRFSLMVSIRNRVTTDVAFEFNAVPSPNALQILRETLGDAVLAGNSARFRMSMEADEAQQKFGQITASPLGERLASLVGASRYLALRETTVPKQTKPVIYGLDGGPKEVNQYPRP